MVMGHKEREKAYDRAWDKGFASFYEGKPSSANPYKQPNFDRLGHMKGGWSLYPLWEAGWNHARTLDNPEIPTQPERTDNA
jgi:hypothetical protein